MRADQSQLSAPVIASLVICLSGCCQDDSDCDTGLYCTVGRCAAGLCVEEERDCGDDVDCTADSCDEDADACSNEPDDTVCDNDLFCDGPERCELTSGCIDGVAPDCSDDIDCTSDTCDESLDVCIILPDDALCDDGVDCTHDVCDMSSGCEITPDDVFCDNGDLCDGLETCDLTAGCQPGEPVICDDDLWCNGTSTCVPATGECVDGTPPDCDDGIDCTVDSCDEEADACSSLPDDAFCDDGLFCNGDERCGEAGCEDGMAPDCSDADECREGVCDEEADLCISLPLTGTPCDAGGGADSGRCFDGACLARGCGDGFVELGPDPPPEECDPGPDGATAGCTDLCRSVDFRVSDLLPEAEHNGSQEVGESDHALAALTDGRFVVVWTRDIGGDCGPPRWPDDYCTTDVEARLFTTYADPEGEVIPVHDDPGGLQHHAVVVPLGDGFLVVWSGDDLSTDARGAVFARSFDELGAPLGAQRRVNTHDFSFHQTPSASATLDGAVVVWEGQLDSLTDALFIRWLDDGGAPLGTEDEVILSDDWGLLRSPAVAVSDDGSTAVVVWQHMSLDLSEPDVLEAMLFDAATGLPLLADPLVVAEPSSGVAVDAPTIAALPDGGFFVVWHHFEDGASSLVGRRVFETGSMDASSVIVPSEPEVIRESPSVVASEDGSPTLAWADDRFPSLDGFGTAVAGARFDFSGPDDAPSMVTDVVVLNTVVSSWQSSPQLAVSGSSTLGVCFTDESLEGGDSDPSQVRCRVLPAGWVVE